MGRRECEMERERELKGKGNERYGQDYSQSSSLVYEVPAHHFSHHFTICGHHKALKWPITSPRKHTHAATEPIPAATVSGIDYPPSLHGAAVQIIRTAD